MITLANRYVRAQEAEIFLKSLPPQSVDLVLIDPPYYGIVDEDWDHQWPNVWHYHWWMVPLLGMAIRAMKPNASLLMFGGVGKHGEHPFYELIKQLEKTLVYRNMITWKKRRAYGKSHDYLFCREEIVWFSRSPGRTDVTFNIPLLDVKRGYAGYNAKYPALSEFKRVSNVWDDIPELMRPRRKCEKPVKLLRRLIETHSNPGDLVVDFFAGTGSTGVAALELGRRFKGCEVVSRVAAMANRDCLTAANALTPIQ